MHQDFWDAWAEKEDSVCSADILIKKQVPDYNLGYPLRQCFQVVTNLALFSEQTPNMFAEVGRGEKRLFATLLSEDEDF